MQEVYTAMSLDAREMERPLLLDEEQNKDSSSKACDQGVIPLFPTFRTHGILCGFLVQVINVTGSTVMFYRWGNEGVFSNLSTNPLDTLLHAIVYALTQVDLVLYLFMWVALTTVLTQSGMHYVRRNYFATECPSKRSVFVLGVQFYIGVVIGVFLAWATVDMVLGLPVPLLPMFGVFSFGLFISYTMIWCYDLEDYLEDDIDKLQV